MKISPLTDEQRQARIDEAERRQKIRDEQSRQQRTAAILNASGLPERHTSSYGDQQPGTQWADACQKAINCIRRGNSVLLAGPRGRGKTQIAVACAFDAADRLRTVRYLKAMQLFRECRQAMKDNCEVQVVDQFCRYGLLIVDEAHVRGETDYEDRTLTEIVDRRYDDMKPTMFITNENKVESAKSLGASIVSRFQESGIVIECDWQSYRNRKA